MKTKVQLNLELEHLNEVLEFCGNDSEYNQVIKRINIIQKELDELNKPNILKMRDNGEFNDYMYDMLESF